MNICNDPIRFVNKDLSIYQILWNISAVIMSQVSRECLWGMESEFGVTYFELSKPLVFYRAGAKKLKFYASLRFRRVNLEFYVNLRFCVTLV